MEVLKVSGRIVGALLIGMAFCGSASSSTVSASSNHRYRGGYGQLVTLTDTSPAFVKDESPVAEKRFRTRGYYKLEPLVMANTDEFDVFVAENSGNVRQFALSILRVGAANYLRWWVKTDAGQVETPGGQEIPLPSGWFAIEIDWKVATAGMNNGYLAIWVNGHPQTGAANLDNDASQIDSSSWGAVAGVDAGTGGAFALDDFVSTRSGGYLGLLSIFPDVLQSDGDWAFIQALYNAGVTLGCGSGDYCPDDPLTRQELALLLLRLREGPDYTPDACETQSFLDVPSDSAFCPWIRELADRDITEGCGGGNYCPDDPVTRQQMAILLLKTLEGSAYLPTACGTEPFDDVPVGDLFCRWINDLSVRAITLGCTDELYCPFDPVSRRTFAVLGARAFALPLPEPF